MLWCRRTLRCINWGPDDVISGFVFVLDGVPVLVLNRKGLGSPVSKSTYRYVRGKRYMNLPVIRIPRSISWVIRNTEHKYIVTYVDVPNDAVYIYPSNEKEVSFHIAFVEKISKEVSNAAKE